MTNTFGGFDTTPVTITSKAMAQAFGHEEKRRREEGLLNIDYYYGRQEQSLLLISDDVDPVILNLTKPIIHKRCTMLYGRPLQREFDGPAVSVAALEDVYRDNSIDALLCQADLYSELTGSSLIHPFPDETLPSGWRLRLYDATQFSCLGRDNNPNTADAIDLIRVIDRLIDPKFGAANKQMPQLERVMQHQVWTTEAVVFYEGNQLQQSEPNPYGFLPFVNFKGEEVHDQYVGWPCANLIRKLNYQVNQLLTHLGFTIKMQAGTPIVLSGFSSGESVVVHPGRALNIPAGAAADVLSLNPKITETLDAIKFLEDRLYTSASVPKISIEGGGDEDKTHISGTQLLIRWYPLTSIFNEKAVRFTRYELELANTVLAVMGLPPVSDVKIEWPEDTVLPYNPLDEYLERDIKLNIRTPIDEIMSRDPLLNEDEAAAELEENKAVNKKNQPAPPPALAAYSTGSNTAGGNVTFSSTSSQGGNGGTSK